MAGRVNRHQISRGRCLSFVLIAHRLDKTANDIHAVLGIVRRVQVGQLRKLMTQRPPVQSGRWLRCFADQVALNYVGISCVVCNQLILLIIGEDEAWPEDVGSLKRDVVILEVQTFGARPLIRT